MIFFWFDLFTWFAVTHIADVYTIKSNLIKNLIEFGKRPLFSLLNFSRSFQLVGWIWSIFKVYRLIRFIHLEWSADTYSRLFLTELGLCFCFDQGRFKTKPTLCTSRQLHICVFCSQLLQKTVFDFIRPFANLTCQPEVVLGDFLSLCLIIVCVLLLLILF